MVSTSENELLQDARKLDEEMSRGKTVDCRPILEELGSRTSPDSQLLSIALRAQLFHHFGAPSVSPNPQELTALCRSAADRRTAARACVLLEREALLQHDRVAHDAYRLVHENVAYHSLDEDVAIPLEISRAWSAWLHGDTRGYDEHLESLRRPATAAGFAELVVELTALRSLIALSEERVVAAVDHGRRASRMARTEALPTSEFLASIVLARARRWQSRPHLAGRILSALFRYAPASWQGWILWEWIFAGANVTSHKDSVERPGAPLSGTKVANSLHALRRLIDSFAGRDLEEFDNARAQLQPELQALADEATMLSMLVDPRRGIDDLPSSLQPWSQGRDHEFPFGLSGLLFPRKPVESQPAAAIVAVSSDGQARRLPAIASELSASFFGVRPLITESKMLWRVDRGLAVLSLAGPQGMSERDFFRSVYDFEYVKEIHGNTLNVLFHRMRKRIESIGALERAHEILSLTPLPSLMVSDPRVSESIDETILRMLGSEGYHAAKDLSTGLSLPLRTVQAALRRLVADESCAAVNKGRAMRYIVEDTTFSEPTMERSFVSNRSYS